MRLSPIRPIFYIFFAHEYLFFFKQQLWKKTKWKRGPCFFASVYVRVCVCMSRVRVHKAAKTMKKECTGILYVHTDIFNACLLLRSLLDAYYLLLLCFSSCCLFVYSCIVHTYRGNKKTWRKYMLCEAIKHVLTQPLPQHGMIVTTKNKNPTSKREYSQFFRIFYYLFIHFCVTWQKSATAHETHSKILGYEYV